MGQIITVDVTIDASAIIDKIEDIFTDDCMLEVNNAFAKFCDPYVPFKEGVLSQQVVVTPQYIEYKGPYAHYQYQGEVYGPNIPILDDDGDVEGWFSPPSKKKKPTGRKLNYNKEFHPQATDHWDKKMMQDKGDVFTQQVENIVNRRAKNV